MRRRPASVRLSYWFPARFRPIKIIVAANAGGKLRGTTLAELLVAVVLLGAAASVLLRSATTAQDRATYSKHRAIISSALRDLISTAHSYAYSGYLSSGSKVSTLVVQGIENPVTITGTATLISGYTSLYLITATATWDEISPYGDRHETMTFSTYVRVPDG